MVNPRKVDITCSLSYSKNLEGKIKYGLASNYFDEIMKNFKEKNQLKLRIYIKSSSFNLPENNFPSITMISTGAGIAPFRAFWQENEFLQKKGSIEFKYKC